MIKLKGDIIADDQHKTCELALGKNVTVACCHKDIILKTQF